MDFIPCYIHFIMIDKEKVFDEYMKWVKQISKDFPEKAGFFPREIVNKVCELAEAKQDKNNEALDLVSFSLPTDDEIKKHANDALFGFGEGRKYDDDYYIGYQDGAKWIIDKHNEI